MKILIACEHTGAVRDAFLARGFDAMSCDILPSEVGGPHYEGDVRDILNDGWDAMIAHPPCTYLCSSGLHWNKRIPGRQQKTEEALAFVRVLFAAPIPHKAIENPVGCIGTRIRKANQYIQPHEFGHDASKTTGLWLEDLPLLESTENVPPSRIVDGKPRWGNQTASGQNRLGPSADRWKARSATYPGIAGAMAKQWGDYIRGLCGPLFGEQLPFPVHRVTAGSLAERELSIRLSKKSGKLYRKTAIPAFAMQKNGKVGLVARRCTTDFKIIPLTKKARELASIKRGQKNVTVTQWIGISWDEIQRMKDSREPWTQMRWPLIEMRMRRDECISWMVDNGYPVPPRSACIFCPFHCNEEWRRVRDGDPDEWEQVQQFERDMQAASAELRAKGDGAAAALRSIPYLHPSCVPIGEADIRSEEERGQLTFDSMLNTLQNDCTGMCGL